MRSEEEEKICKDRRREEGGGTELSDLQLASNVHLENGEEKGGKR